MLRPRSEIRQKGATEDEPEEGPVGEVRLLFAVSSLDGYRVGAGLAGLVASGTDDSLVLFHGVLPRVSETEEEIQNVLRQLGQDPATTPASAGLSPKACILRDTSDPAASILEVAAEVNADLILMTSHQRHGAARLLVGSVTEHLVKIADRPVLSVPLAYREAPFPDLARVLMPVVESRISPLSLRWARTMARRGGGDPRILQLIHDNRPLPAGMPARGTHQQQGALELKGTGPELTLSRTVLRSGSSTAEILDHATDWGASLIVLTRWTAGRRQDVFIGSTIERCLRHSRCPVLVVPNQELQNP